MIHHTLIEDAAVHPSGWVPISDTLEITRLPIIDRAQVLPNGEHLFARLNYAEAVLVAQREGGRLIGPAELEELRRRGLQLTPYLGTPTAENDVVHSIRHDADVWRQLGILGWDGEAPVAGAGKHWLDGAPAGKSRLGGWDKDGAGPGLVWWQPPSVAHNRQHFDDGTTTVIVRPRRGASASPGDGPASLASMLVGFGKRLGGGLLGLFRAAPSSTATPSPRTNPKVTPMPPKTFSAELACVTKVIPDRYVRRRPRAVEVIVMHTAECGKTATAGEAVAGYLVSTDKASAHFVVDIDSTIQQVPLDYVAGAAPGANDQGVQIEMVGRAAQTPEEWRDAYNLEMLDRAARLVAELCDRFDLPPVFVDAAGLKAGARGITTHAAVSVAFRLSTHTDPGKNFPMKTFLDAVSGYMSPYGEAG